jgi:ParB family chromosome partitioning protein
MRHEAVKCQGKRTDLINEIENLLKNDENTSENADNQFYSQVGKKINNVVKLGEEYGLSKNSVARYLRINNLNDGLKSLVDDTIIAFLAAVSLSYISAAGQTLLFAILEDNPEFKVDIKKAGQLREFSEGDSLTRGIIEDVLSGAAAKAKKKAQPSLPVQSLKIGGKILSKYFDAEQTPDEIQAELFEALEFYRKHKKT